MAAFNKLDALRLTDDGDQLRAVLAMEQEMGRIRRAIRALPQGWRGQVRGWARNASTDLRALWQEERDRSPEGAPTFEDVATLVGLLRNHDGPAAPLNAAVQAGYLTSQDATKISTYAVTWAEEDDPRERVSRGLRPMQDALDAFVRKANRVLHPEESEEDSGEA
ncbi:hypothetical protein J8N05_46440 (plasmid) [Streptomyces sp. BH-SS-21]|uniref:Uncharacterized protein n=1 Tax=Streptomyces liliiviolaceus TaxID=2823109 RepID=A0A940Y6R6_9ACTN|nr:hypothetical protein [Streptomyces liliiviolaceus]MBQ0855603.1 hypothetical protein [Streptomyces liliiviolaceus]